MNFLQLRRYKKALNETYYVLDITESESSFNIVITGSTYNVYNIDVSKNTYKINCNCPDAHKCEKDNMFCKHICFVYVKLIKQTKEYLFFYKKLFQTDITKLKLLSQNYIENPLVSEILREKYLFQTHLVETEEKIVPLNLKDDCPICFETIENDLHTCKVCRNAFHIECLKIWLKNKNTCVLCRNKISLTEEKSKYLNLNSSSY